MLLRHFFELIIDSRDAGSCDSSCHLVAGEDRRRSTSERLLIASPDRETAGRGRTLER